MNDSELGVRGDDDVLTSLGARLREARLDRNQTQAQLASAAGVSEPTVRRIEAGHSAQTRSLTRILRELGLPDLDAAVPSQPPSPLASLERRDRRRQRARPKSPGDTSSQASSWTWDDEAGDE